MRCARSNSKLAKSSFCALAFCVAPIFLGSREAPIRLGAFPSRPCFEAPLDRRQRPPSFWGAPRGNGRPSSNESLIILSSPKVSNAWGHAGPRYQGLERGPSAKDAASQQDHVALSSDLPAPVSNGFHIPPGDVRVAVRYITERGASRAEGFWGEQIKKLRRRAEELRPKLLAFREGLKVGCSKARARLHLLMLAGLSDDHEMRGPAWRRQFIDGSLTSGHSAESGGRPVDTDAAAPISR